ncbi:MAG: hypothetical protein AAB364_00345 [Patescibacteria group bacterium]
MNKLITRHNNDPTSRATNHLKKRITAQINSLVASALAFAFGSNNKSGMTFS